MRREGGRLLLEGPLTLDTVPQIAGESAALFAGGVSAVDFGAVTEVDSSAVALALEWRREAGGRNAALRLENVPVAMRRLADLYGVTELLQLVKQ